MYIFQGDSIHLLGHNIGQTLVASINPHIHQGILMIFIDSDDSLTCHYIATSNLAYVALLA